MSHFGFGLTVLDKTVDQTIETLARMASFSHERLDSRTMSAAPARRLTALAAMRLSKD